MVLSASIGAIGALGSAAMGMISANAQSSAQKELMEHQAYLNYYYAKKSALNSPSWNRKGLENAGYNPMLAVQNSTSGANSSWSSGGNASMADNAHALSEGITNALGVYDRELQTKQTDSNIDVNSSTAEKQRAEASNLRAENPYISKREEANLRRTDAETGKLQSETEYNSALIENLDKRLELDRYLGVLEASTQRRGQDLTYNASTFATNQATETARGTISSRLPFGFGSTKYFHPDDIIRMTHRALRPVYDSHNKKYWHYY